MLEIPCSSSKSESDWQWLKAASGTGWSMFAEARVALRVVISEHMSGTITKVMAEL